MSHKCENPGCKKIIKDKPQLCSSCGRKVCDLCWFSELQLCGVCGFYYFQRQERKLKKIQAAKNLMNAVLNVTKDYDEV